MTSTPAGRRRNNKIPALNFGIVVVRRPHYRASPRSSQLFLTWTAPEPNGSEDKYTFMHQYN